MRKDPFLIGENGRLSLASHFTIMPPPVGRHPTLQLESATLMRATALVTGRRHTERRTLQRVLCGTASQPNPRSLVRGSSPTDHDCAVSTADIRVINRRI